jgi:hypothetical protein
MSKHSITAEVCIPGQVSVYSEKAQDISRVKVIGELADDVVMQIRVSRDGHSQFGLVVDSSGTLILTDYAGLNYRGWIPQNFRLEPATPWPGRNEPKKQEEKVVCNGSRHKACSGCVHRKPHEKEPACLSITDCVDSPVRVQCVPCPAKPPRKKK